MDLLTENTQALQKGDADVAILFVVVVALELLNGRPRPGAGATIGNPRVITAFPQSLLNQGDDLARGSDAGSFQRPKNR
jgi:hypothetical protein